MVKKVISPVIWIVSESPVSVHVLTFVTDELTPWDFFKRKICAPGRKNGFLRQAYQ